MRGIVHNLALLGKATCGVTLVFLMTGCLGQTEADAGFAPGVTLASRNEDPRGRANASGPGSAPFSAYKPTLKFVWAFIGMFCLDPNSIVLL